MTEEPLRLNLADVLSGYRRGREVSELARGSVGRWPVRCDDATHVWDLDRGTYLRLPDPDANTRRRDTDLPRRPFAHDGIEIRIVRVAAWPTVGETAWVWREHPWHATVDCFRRSRKVLSIAELVPVEQQHG